MTERQRILVETAAARDKAEQLLRGLVDAKKQSEKYLADAKQTDAIKAVTGRSAIDNAIASAQRMHDSLSRALAELRKELSDEDLALLEHTDHPAGPDS